MPSTEADAKAFFTLVAVVIVLICLFIPSCMWGAPKYRIYTQTMRGQADFKEAEINRQILVEEARAQEEALQMRAKGEAEREKIKADATAYAIDKIGASLQASPAYLRWMWINEISTSEKGERIYIPTEAGLPILEAGK